MGREGRRRAPRPGREKGEYEGTIQEMDRAIRRLDMLEYLILLGIALMALLGGAIGAWLLSVGNSLSFFRTWVVLSLLLFVVPGGIVLWKQRQEAKKQDIHRNDG